MMAGGVPTIWWYDHFEERKGILHTVGAPEHTEAINAEDTLHLRCEETPEKGDRLVWHDAYDGRWREHVVERVEEPIDQPCEVWAEGSLVDLLGDYIEEKHLVKATSAAAISACLEGTRWAVRATAPVGGTFGCHLYHTNVLAALRKVCEVWDCDLATQISMDDGRVSAREAWLTREPAGYAARLTYGKGLAECKRTVLEDQVVTALYGWGVGIPATDEKGQYTGGYSRRLDFSEVNEGSKWVGDDEAREQWGVWNADRTQKMHRFADVTFPDCDEPEQLRSLTLAALRLVCQPQVTYLVDAAALTGCDHVGLGDGVIVDDSSRTPIWHLKARVARRKRTFGDDVRVEITLGTRRDTGYEIADREGRRISLLTEAVGMTEAGKLGWLGSDEFVSDSLESYDVMSDWEF